jgi:nicotinamidase-related amidase
MDLASAPGQGDRLIRVQDRTGYKARMNELLELDPRSTTVVSVDLQRDYIDLDVASNPVPPAEAERMMKSCMHLLELARELAVPVIHSYVVRTMAEYEAGVFGNPYSRLSHEQKLSQNVWKGVREIPDRLEGSPQAQIPAELLAPSDLHVTSKRTNDSCYCTNLPILLERVCKPEAVLLLGVNTDTCVYSTAFSISNRGYRTVVIEDCVASTRGLDHHVMALELMSRTFCWVLNLEEASEKLRAGAAAAGR